MGTALTGDATLSGPLVKRFMTTEVLFQSGVSIVVPAPLLLELSHLHGNCPK